MFSIMKAMSSRQLHGPCGGIMRSASAAMARQAPGCVVRRSTACRSMGQRDGRSLALDTYDDETKEQSRKFRRTVG